MEHSETPKKTVAKKKNTVLNKLLCTLLIAVCFCIALAVQPTSAESENKEIDKPKEKPLYLNVETQEAFKKEVLKKPVMSVVYFHAKWCGACKQYGPVFEDVARKKRKDLHFVKIDVDKAKNIAADYKIEYLPTTIIFKDGKEQNRIVGAASEKDLNKAMKKVSKQVPGKNTT